jgi:hypothetical protein
LLLAHICPICSVVAPCLPGAALRDLRNESPLRDTRRIDMFGTSIKLDKALYAKVKRYADLAGYSSVDEFVTHALEKEIAHLEDADSPEEIKKRLKGLGYIS